MPPHRKPLPAPPATSSNIRNDSSTSTSQQYPPAHSPPTTTQSGSHSLTMSSISGPPQPVQPKPLYQTPYQQQQHLNHAPLPALPPQLPFPYLSSQTVPSQQQQPLPSARRTLSNATSSTSSSNQGSAFAATNPTYPSSITRSPSSRSALAPSYVALMRKQKATVWCDRAQYEDPHMQAQLRAAKARAAKEVVGASKTSTRTSTTTSSGVRNKIRHHGAVKASAYTAGGAGVPMRLSASEVEDEDGSEDERDAIIANYGRTPHERNGSGRSSLGSLGNTVRMGSLGAQTSSLNINGTAAAVVPDRNNDLTPPTALGKSSSYGSNMGHAAATTIAGPRPSTDTQDSISIDREGETRLPLNGGGSGSRQSSFGDYFQQTNQHAGSSGEANNTIEERDFGLAANQPRRRVDPVTGRRPKAGSEDELRRRGSVDDRAMTMSGVRLFVANPDLSD